MKRNIKQATRRTSYKSKTKNNLAKNKRIRLWSFIGLVIAVASGIVLTSPMGQQMLFNLDNKSDFNHKSSKTHHEDNVELDTQDKNQLSKETKENEKNSVFHWQVIVTSPLNIISQEEIEQYLKNNPVKNYFSLKTKEMNHLLEKHPWIKSASTRKVWPNRLLLDLEEHIPWLNLNGYQLVSTEGVVFEPGDMLPFYDLPRLEGGFGNINDLLDMYHFFVEQMPIQSLKIKTLQFREENGWSILLSNQITLFLGRKKLNEKLERLLVLMNKISNKEQKRIDYIDLRYASAAAIGWKDSASESVHQFAKLNEESTSNKNEKKL